MISDIDIKEVGRSEFVHGKPLDDDYINDEQLLHAVEKMFYWGAGFACFGTLLGLVRDGRLMARDTDIDYYVTNNRLQNLINAIRSMRDSVTVARKEDTFITLQTLGRKISIDIYLCYIEDKHQQRLVYAHDQRNWNVGGLEMKWNTAMHIKNKMRFWIPNNPQHCLQCWYGPNWRTPVGKEEFYGTENTEKKD